ncbi:CdaR family protein [Polaribacter sp. Hel_I_88]|uniref:CdaR family protein n=1 Tax=Polaribacter sp. Hel_I_88 TaxID=1250006 RepID=UPI000A549110|nr:YbbR-like domain-containing protein [Polaribacter sp. Hel_I_88]
MIWLLITFSKEYTTVITYPVNYNNIAQDKLLQESPIKKIDLSITATGFKILRAKLNTKKINIEASNLRKKSASKFYILPKNQITKIQKQLLNGIVIQEILQDTIFLNLGVLTSKKVALKPQVNITYHIGYDLLDELIITPDSIVISGPEDQLNSITHLNLSPLNLKGVKASFTKEVSILKSKNQKNLKFKDTKVTITGKVDKFTEGTVKVPFIIKNLPEDTDLTILTDNVEIVYVVALSNFAKVSEASFIIECDYAMAVKNDVGYLIPKITTDVDFIKNIKIIPSKIDFLIQK